MQRSSVATVDNAGHKWYILRFSSALFAFVSWTSSLSLMVLSSACRNWDIFFLSFVVDLFSYFVFFFIVVALVSLLFSHVCLFSCVCSFLFFTSSVCLSYLFVVVFCFVFKSLSSVVFVFSLQLFFIFLPLLFILFIFFFLSLSYFFSSFFFLMHVFFLSLSFSFIFVFLSCSSHFPCSFFLSHFCSSLSFVCFSITLLSFPLNTGCLELASLATWCTTSSQDRKDWLESVMEEEVPQPSWLRSCEASLHVIYDNRGILRWQRGNKPGEGRLSVCCVRLQSLGLRLYEILLDVGTVNCLHSFDVGALNCLFNIESLRKVIWSLDVGAVTCLLNIESLRKVIWSFIRCWGIELFAVHIVLHMFLWAFCLVVLHKYRAPTTRT